jgi:hypothetical protein
VHFGGKPVTGPVVINQVRSFYEEMKIMNRCTFSKDCFESTCYNVALCRYCVIIQNI